METDRTVTDEMLKLAFDEPGPIDPAKLEAFRDSLKDLPSVTYELTFVPNEWTLEKLLFVQTWKPEDVDDRERFLAMLHAAIAAELRAQYPEVLKTLAAVAMKVADQTALLQRSLEMCALGGKFVEDLVVLAEDTTDQRVKDLAAVVVDMFHVTEEPVDAAQGC